MTRPANPERGEVDLVLDGTPFGLRPSHEALLEIEAPPKEDNTGGTGKAAIELMNLAGDGKMSLTDATVITTILIKAWGRQVAHQVASNVDRGRIGQLIMEYGLMQVQLRLVMVLGNAVTGGCKADGTMKPGEAKPAPKRGRRK